MSVARLVVSEFSLMLRQRPAPLSVEEQSVGMRSVADFGAPRVLLAELLRRDDDNRDGAVAGLGRVFVDIYADMPELQTGSGLFAAELWPTTCHAPEQGWCWPS